MTVIILKFFLTTLPTLNIQYDHYTKFLRLIKCRLSKMNSTTNCKVSNSRRRKGKEGYITNKKIVK